MGDFIPDVELNTIISYLSKGIKIDRDLFVKAKIDPMFNNVRPQVDILLENIFHKTKSNAEKEVFFAESTVKKMENWINSDYASLEDKQKFELVQNKIFDAKGKLKTQSYFGYIDVLEIMAKTNEIIEEVQSSREKKLDFFKSQKKKKY